MSRQTDPVSIIPSASVVRESLTDARCRVSTLEFLLGVAEGVEACRNSTNPSLADKVECDGTESYNAGKRLAEITSRTNRPINVDALLAEVQP